jgi:hypothetical protein
MNWNKVNIVTDPILLAFHYRITEVSTSVALEDVQCTSQTFNLKLFRNHQ